jgi:hypothetical protein
MSVMYGASHAQQNYDLDEMLPGDSAATITIALFATPDSVLYLDHDLKLDISDVPHYFYIISTDEMIQIIPGTVSEQQYWLKICFTFTKQEYDQAVNTLPENLKKHAYSYGDYLKIWSRNPFASAALQQGQHLAH